MAPRSSRVVPWKFPRHSLGCPVLPGGSVECPSSALPIPQASGPRVVSEELSRNCRGVPWEFPRCTPVVPQECPRSSRGLPWLGAPQAHPMRSQGVPSEYLGSPRGGFQGIPAEFPDCSLGVPEKSPRSTLGVPWESRRNPEARPPKKLPNWAAPGPAQEFQFPGPGSP